MRTALKKRTEIMRKEYDFSKAEVGKYANRFATGHNIVVIEPDLIAKFPDSKSVNTALRQLIKKRGRPAPIGRTRRKIS